MKIDSSKYVKPAVAYFQELVSLASEKGFIMSRVNARELSNRLSDIINNDFIYPILKVNISLTVKIIIFLYSKLLFKDTQLLHFL